jgi:hypothetical protein
MWIALVLLAQSAGTLVLADRAEARARVTQGATPTVGYDVVNDASARLRVTDRRWDLLLGYSANVIAPDVETSLAPIVLHFGNTEVAWHDRRLRLSLGEAVTYGQQNAALLQGGGATLDGKPVAVQALYAPTTIHFASIRTIGSAQLQLDRRWMTRVMGVYLVSGGLDAAARTVAPYLRSPSVDAVLSYQATRIDWVETRVDGQLSDAEASPCAATIHGANVTTSCAPQVQTGQIVEAWRHAVSRSSQLSLGAGASGLRIRLRPTAEYSSFLLPSAVAAFDYRTGSDGDRSLVRGDLQVAPVLDYVTGLGDYRAQGTLQLRMLIRRTTLGALVGAARSLETLGINPVTIVRAESSADLALEKWVSVGVGLRLAWQDQEPLGAFYTFVGLGYVTFTAPVTRF